MARRIIGTSRLSQRTSGEAINSNFKELYDLIYSGIGDGEGIVGPKGDKGDTGAQGPQGPIGPKGDTGDQGPQGVAGPTGPQGPQGERGFTGAKGDTGATGATGPKGDKGDTGDTGPAGPAGGSGSTKIATFETVADMAAANIPAIVTGLVVLGYATVNDSPQVRYRRATVAEQPLPGVVLGQNGYYWIINETLLIPEWFGAKGNSTGASGSGNDDAPAFRNMLDLGAALSVQCTNLPGRKYRMASHISHRGGQKTVFAPKSNTHLTVRGDVIHDSYDAVTGAVSFFFTNGISTDRAKNIKLKFDGGGFIHPSDAVKPTRPNGTEPKKGSITMYYTDDFEIIRVAKSGPSPTNFQVSIFNSSYGFVDGGKIGYPVGPTEVGDDGFHIIGNCRSIIASGFIINSGDDPISLTCELNMTGATIQDVFISDVICTTPIANLIKIHIVSVDSSDPDVRDTTNNCTIKNVYISNVRGALLGNIKGAICTINNDDPSKGNVIKDIYIDRLDGDIGTLPKTEATISLQGQAIRVRSAEEVHFTNVKVTGQQNAQLLFSLCKNCSFNGTLVNSLTNNNNVAMLSNLTVASAMVQGSTTRRRITFSGSPDLTAVKTQVDKAAVTDPVINEIKFPILTLTGMTTAGHNGSFVIRSVDTTNYWVEVDNFRSGTSDEAAATGTGSISSGTMPVIAILECENIKVNARVVNPLSWATAYSSGRATTNKRCEINLEIEGQRFGYGIYSQKSERAEYSVIGRNCKSGSYMILSSSTGGASLTPFNHFKVSTDADGLADAQSGWARTVTSEYASDRFDLIRGRTPTRLEGTITQLAGVSALGPKLSSNPDVYGGINANISTYGSVPAANITPRHLLKLTPRTSGKAADGSGTGHGGVSDISWDITNAKFVINTNTAPTQAVVWDYVIGFPN